ncbi:hypothetical protein HanPSC8_Chr10g0429211 [Helianthus annuus]|nr:hypothetical protein HanPSC8_Chr10g0429211 [Helianthus annuus]
MTEKPMLYDAWDDFMALLAYKELEQSPVFHLLSLEYPQHVVEQSVDP